ncbi:TetR/AcrR family transcriptional regulator C-terminal domain-containing protein [Caulobacter sp. RL271]|jgi:TetR/AcrR family tetracycline transcriptional repressor|uniref:TetR/AcrR family transcriptional regulator C-terminal domain-containing protein n=1 Tax=Caulobacter segnis TaxID=88688 RepID=A0ABY4ZRB6_9CAUL|nr:TetR/AcrR family transcriptional regulator C-terminal domain-containing protein [Caulobacter segnis]USQ95143.1 TetR/AcrR family transcriptional regulator C-terminal domain-containing protein [Caulobacter segnis]
MKVDRRRILETALELLNEVGVDALSTRVIADRLGVRQPALYWHFKNKQALLDALNGEILARASDARTPRPGETWQDFLRRNARSFRAALLSYRDGARVHAGTEAAPDDLDHVEAQILHLAAAGFSPGAALQLFVAVSRFVVGCVLEEQTSPISGSAEQARLDEAARAYPALGEAIAHYREGGHEALFERGLDLIVKGAEVELAQARLPPS